MKKFSIITILLFLVTGAIYIEASSTNNASSFWEDYSGMGAFALLVVGCLIGGVFGIKMGKEKGYLELQKEHLGQWGEYIERIHRTGWEEMPDSYLYNLAKEELTEEQFHFWIKLVLSFYEQYGQQDDHNSVSWLIDEVKKWKRGES